MSSQPPAPPAAHDRTRPEGSPGKPWWKKKRVIIPAILFVLLGIASTVAEDPTGSEQVANVAADESPDVTAAEISGSATNDEDSTSTTSEVTTTSSTVSTTGTPPTTASTTVSSTTTTALPTTMRYPPRCQADVRLAASISVVQDTWPDLWPAFESCQTAEAFLNAVTDFDPDGRWDVFTKQSYLAIGDVYACRQEEWPDGPYDTNVCKELLAQIS